MRMWNVDPKIMCRKHLLGEHVELHMFVGTILVKKSLKGYVEKNLVQPRFIVGRHKELVREMKRRGYNHNSNLPDFNLSNLPNEIQRAKVNVKDSLADLVHRCKECKLGLNNLNYAKIRKLDNV